ncbi:unnamed protein product [Paramecium octaurelia]|uniref:Uncharacterized protein n=1 Tax=Paramecium octaurelia TaxID=43137 RepID=A0A8S1Y7S2_PAROT|nr:unnamed protein product [Paramecium octaurelia]
MQQIYQYPWLIDVPPYLASYCVGYHKEYPFSLYQYVFEPDIMMKPNYKAIKTFDPQELVRYLQNNFPLIRRNIFQFEDQMKQLNQIFGQIVIKGFHIDDFFKQFCFVLEQKLHKFFDDLDQYLFKLNGKQTQELIPGDYRIGDTRKHIRQKLIDMSNDLVSKFASRTTPQEYDREVIRKIDQILRIYELLKYEYGWHFLINITKFNLEDLLERLCNNEPTQFQKIDELIESMFIISMKKIKDVMEHESTSPLFVFNKNAVLSRFHSIINDRQDPQMSTDDLYYISKTVCMRDRRIIYKEFCDQINQELKEIAPEYFQFATTEKCEYQKEREELHKILLKTQNDWESLKEDEIYYLILEDRINEEDLRKVPLTTERQLHQLQNLNAFAIKASNLQYDATTLFQKILDHKDKSKAYFETKLQEALDKAKQYYIKMTPGRTPSSNQIKQYVDSLYSELANLLNSDFSKCQRQMSQTDKSVEQQLARNNQNPYLQQVETDLQKQQQVRDHLQKNPFIDTQIQKPITNPDPLTHSLQKEPSDTTNISQQESSIYVDPPQNKASTKTYPPQQQPQTNISPSEKIHERQAEPSNPIELNQKNIIGLNQSFQSQISSGSEFNPKHDDKVTKILKEKYQPKIEVEEIDQNFITPEMLPLINKYIKGTKYGKKTTIKMKEFNSFEYVIQLFEDFITQDEVYLLDFDVVKKLFDIFEKLISQEEVQDDVQRLVTQIERTYQEITGRENFVESKIFFPLQNNPFLFYLVEKDPISKQLKLYYDKQPNEDHMGEEFDRFLFFLQQVFYCEEFEISQVILPPQSKKKLDSFGADGYYIKYMMTVFAIIYEQQNIKENIIINDDTIARAFWALNQYTELYTTLQENEENVRNTFTEMVEQAQKNNNTVIITQIVQPYLEKGIQNLSLQVQEIYDHFLSNKVIKQAFISIEIDIQEQEQKNCLYVHLQKVQQLNFLQIFMLKGHKNFNEDMCNILLMDTDLFTKQIYLDFPRHNILSNYIEVSLGAFYHLVVEQNLTPKEAMANLFFSVVPYNLILKQQE